MNQRRVLLIDSFGVLFRAYFALEKTGLSTKDGRYTFAIYGFFKSLFKVIQEIQPNRLVLALESQISRRKIIDPQYKANRKEQPQALLDQIVLFYKILEETQLPSIKIEGYEADDVLATLSSEFEESGAEIFIYSSDKDLAQLVNSRIVLVQPSKSLSQPLNIIDVQGVIKKYGVSPNQMVDYLTIVGDVSDNVRGVSGVGPKTASMLLNQYGSLENIYHHMGELTPHLQKKFQAAQDIVKLGKDLISLYKDIAVYTKDNLGVWTNEHISKLNQVFKNLEFSPFKEIFSLGGLVVVSPESEQSEVSLFSGDGHIVQHSTVYNSILTQNKDYKLIVNIQDLQEVISCIVAKGFVCMDTETTGLDIRQDRLLGISFSWQSHQGVYIPLVEPYLSIQEVTPYLKRVLEASDIKKIGHNLKFDYQVLIRYFPEIQGLFFDTMLAAYLLNPDGKKYSLDELAIEYFRYQKIAYKDLVNGKEYKNLSQADVNRVKDYAAEDTDITYQLYEILAPRLEEQNLQHVFFDLEIPMVKILAHMEIRGISVNIPYFQSLDIYFQEQLQDISSKIFKLAGEEFNLNSPKQISGILYDKLKLPKPKNAGRSKSVFATDEDSLQKLSEFQIVQYMLEYRKYHKLRSTYVVPICQKAYSDEQQSIPRIYTHFQQTGTATGRLSSTDPNLQNIPVKDDVGRMIRRGFIAQKDYLLMSLDYSQIELRLMAHFSEDANLIDAFQKDEDIHLATASKIFAKSSHLVSAKERSIAKMINFGIIYGMGSFKLAKELKISGQEAKDFIQRYFELFHGVSKFIQGTKNYVHHHQYVSTLLGRKRFFPDILSGNQGFVAMNERMAVNTIIQGSNADLMKRCMIQLQDQDIIRETDLLLQIHDELVFEVPKSLSEDIGRKIKHIMENIYTLRVPLKVSLNFGMSWEDLK